jgi:hypothetical protein
MPARKIESHSPPEESPPASFVDLTAEDLIVLGFTILLALTLIGGVGWASHIILGRP